MDLHSLQQLNNDFNGSVVALLEACVMVNGFVFTVKAVPSPPTVLSSGRRMSQTGTPSMPVKHLVWIFIPC